MKADGFFEVHQLTRMESASPTPQQRLVACVRVCRVDVADVVTREPGIATQGKWVCDGPSVPVTTATVTALRRGISTRVLWADR